MFGVFLAVGVVCCCECGCASGKLGVARSMDLDRECLVMIMYVGVGLVVRLNNNKGVIMGESVGVCGCIFVF